MKGDNGIIFSWKGETMSNERNRLVKIPRPKFVVFYNGVETQPDYQEMRLSDFFYYKSSGL